MFSKEKANKVEVSELDDDVLIEAFGIKKEDIFEARYNLLGFYGTLQKIKWRLEKEGKL